MRRVGPKNEWPVRITNQKTNSQGRPEAGDATMIDQCKKDLEAAVHAMLAEIQAQNNQRGE